MPLQLGGVSTERAQIIAFDPAVAAEVDEALARSRELVGRGFSVRSGEPGQIALDPPARDPNIGLFRILSQNGDDRIVWDRRDPNQVREAFAKFKELLKSGYTAFATLMSGKRSHKIEDFDPALEEIIMAAGEVVMVPPTIPG